MLRPRTASTAGRNVVASRTATSTTNSPPTPTDRVSESGVVSSAAKPTTTVNPDVITADPAVSTVRPAAPTGESPRFSSPGNPGPTATEKPIPPPSPPTGGRFSTTPAMGPNLARM